MEEMTFRKGELVVKVQMEGNSEQKAQEKQAVRAALEQAGYGMEAQPQGQTA